MTKYDTSDLQALFDSRPPDVLNYDVPRPKLSDLIRQGAAKHPQAFGMWWDKRNIEGKAEPVYPIQATCALGAAAVAIGVTSGAGVAELRLKALIGYMWSDAPKLQLPAGVTDWNFEHADKPVRLFYAVEVLNDSARWSREKIADWLQSIGY